MDLNLGELLNSIDHRLENDQQPYYGTEKRKRQRQCSPTARPNYYQSTAASTECSSQSAQSTYEQLLYMTSCSEDILGFDETPKTASTASKAAGCDCSTALTRLLSQTSDHLYRHGTDRNENSSPPIDSLLICLDSGLIVCEGTLHCNDCNGKVGDCYLITTAVHRLGGIARQLAEALCPERTCKIEHCFRDHGGDEEYDDLDESLEDFDVWVAKVQQNDCHADSIILQEQVSVGYYTVNNPQSKLRFVFSLVLEIFSRLRKLLDRVKHRVRHNRTAWNVVVDSEYLVVQALSLIRERIVR